MSSERFTLPTRRSENSTNSSSRLGWLVKILVYLVPALLFALGIVMLGSRRNGKPAVSNNPQPLEKDVSKLLKHPRKRALIPTPVEIQLTNTTNVEPLLPHFAFSDVGNAMMLVWHNVDNDASTQFFDLSGVPKSGPVSIANLAPLGQKIFDVDTSVDCQNHTCVIAWSDASNGDVDTWIQKFDPYNGAFIPTQIQLNTVNENDNQYGPAVRVYPGGNVIVSSWQSWGDSSSFNINGAVLDADLSITNPDYTLNSLQLDSQMYPSTAIINSNMHVTIWASGAPDPKKQAFEFTSIRGNLFNTTGAPIRAEFQVNTSPNIHNTPTVAAKTNGFLAAWKHYPTGPAGKTNILYQRFNLLGDSIGLEGQLTDTPNNFNRPSLASFPNDASALAYFAGPQGSENTFVQFLDSNDQKVGDPLRFNTNTIGAQKYLDIKIKDHQVHGVFVGGISGNYAVFKNTIDPKIQLSPSTPLEYTYDRDTPRTFHPDSTLQIQSLLPKENVTLTISLPNGNFGEFTTFLPFAPFTTDPTGFNTQGNSDNVNLMLKTMGWKPAPKVNSNITATYQVCQKWLGYCQNGTIKLIGLPFNEPAPNASPGTIQKINAGAIAGGVGAGVVAIGTIISVAFWRRSVSEKAKERAKHPLADAVRKALGLKGADDFQTGVGKQFLTQMDLLEDKLLHDTYLQETVIDELSDEVLATFAGYIATAIEANVNFKTGKRFDETDLKGKRDKVIQDTINAMKEDNNWHPTQSDKPEVEAISFEDTDSQVELRSMS